MISGINSALSGLTAFQKKIESTSHNVANINTDGFKKTRVTLANVEPHGVIATISKVDSKGVLTLEQNSKGQQLVEKSNVKLTEELPNLLLSKHFFEANLKVIKSKDEIIGSLLNIKG